MLDALRAESHRLAQSIRLVHTFNKVGERGDPAPRSDRERGRRAAADCRAGGRQSANSPARRYASAAHSPHRSRARTAAAGGGPSATVRSTTRATSTHRRPQRAQARRGPRRRQGS